MNIIKPHHNVVHAVASQYRPAHDANKRLATSDYHNDDDSRTFSRIKLSPDLFIPELTEE